MRKKKRLPKPIIEVRIVDGGRTIQAVKGETLWKSLTRHKLINPAGCGERGKCDTCQVGIVTSSGSYSAHSCQYPLTRPITVEITSESE